MSYSKPKTLNRVYLINNVLIQTIHTIYKLRKIGYNVSNGKLIYAYAISLSKDSTQTIEEQATTFYNVCKNLLNDSEQLFTDNKCLKIVSDEFELYYCLEAWRKHADKIVYIEDGQIKVEFLHRMSCEQAAYIFKKYNLNPFEFINTLETLKKYNNPADRYTALAKSPFSHYARQTAIRNK